MQRTPGRHLSFSEKLNTRSARAPRATPPLRLAWLLPLALWAGALASPAVAQTQGAAAKKAAHKKHTGRAARANDTLVGTGPAYGQHAGAQAWAQGVAERQKLPLAWVQKALAEARQSPTVVQLSRPPASPQAKNWTAYRSRFLDELRINAGLNFWQAHAAELARAEKTYGVPAEIVVGILGVETIYGREMGRFRVLDALATLAFDFPAEHPRAAERSEYFKKELEQFLAQQYRAKLPVTAARGSYAGAQGMPQFMPSSRAQFAVDFDGDGRIDLTNSTSDVIGSVAHYLNAFNWRPGMPTHYPVAFDPARLDMDTLMAPDILPTFSVASFTAKGAVLEGPALSHEGPLALVELLNGPAAPSYVAGTENFYVVTRYNWSSYYAMAVIELGQAVAKRSGR